MICDICGSSGALDAPHGTHVCLTCWLLGRKPKGKAHVRQTPNYVHHELDGCPEYDTIGRINK